MRVLVLGSGLMGCKAAVEDLIKDGAISGVGVNDIDKKKLERIAKANSGKVSVSSVDIQDHNALVKLLGKFDVAINALPRKFTMEVLEAAIEAGTDIVDMTLRSSRWTSITLQGTPESLSSLGVGLLRGLVTCLFNTERINLTE